MSAMLKAWCPILAKHKVYVALLTTIKVSYYSRQERRATATLAIVVILASFSA